MIYCPAHLERRVCYGVQRDNRPHNEDKFRKSDKGSGISRGSVCYNPSAVSDTDLKPTHRIDKLQMKFSFIGCRMQRGRMCQEGLKVGGDCCHGDGANGNRGALTQAEHLQPGTRSQIPPFSAPKTAHHSAQSGLGDGHYLHSHGAGLHLPRCLAELVHPARPGMARVEYSGGRLVHRSCRGDVGTLPHAIDIQDGSGHPVRVHRLHQGAGRPRHQDQLEWQGHLARQGRRRAPLANHLMRRSLLASLCQRSKSPSRNQLPSRLLQQPPTTFIASQENPDQAYVTQPMPEVAERSRGENYLENVRICSDSQNHLTKAFPSTLEGSG